MAAIVVAVVQAAPVWMDKAATIEKACGLIARAAASGAKVIAFPESFIPAFPYGVWHHGLHRNNDFFKQLYEQAVVLPGAGANELAPICEAAKAAGALVVMGLTERAGGSLYNTQAFIGPDGSLMGARRKLKPTSAERLVWGEGDGSGMRVFETPFGKVGGLMCGEHNLALARYTLQALGEQIHVASYPDPMMEGRPFADRLEAAVRHYAAEGQCFVLNATGFISPEIRELVFDTPQARAELEDPRALNGASSIIAPNGQVLAGPLSGEEGILTASIDVANIAYAKYWFDAAGHSGRGDIFKLQVDFSARQALGGLERAGKEGASVAREVKRDG
jgi:aliphatic nitrilase